MEIKKGYERFLWSDNLKSQFKGIDELNLKIGDIKTQVERFKYPLLFPTKYPIVDIDALSYVKPAPMNCFI